VLYLHLEDWQYENEDAMRALFQQLEVALKGKNGVILARPLPKDELKKAIFERFPLDWLMEEVGDNTAEVAMSRSDRVKVGYRVVFTEYGR
jgi:hypothetical protein